MDIPIITPKDLEIFRRELVDEISELLTRHKYVQPRRKWLKSDEVMRLLAIAPSTLQNLRNKGILPFSKIGGVIYYDYDDLQRVLQERKT